uniref:Uncharacterized protein n=1 Tax=Micrurus corallinus TaxID=54390 RepID=A0A2D4GFL3_MICCO
MKKTNIVLITIWLLLVSLLCLSPSQQPSSHTRSRRRREQLRHKRHLLGLERKGGGEAAENSGSPTVIRSKSYLVLFTWELQNNKSQKRLRKSSTPNPVPFWTNGGLVSS